MHSCRRLPLVSSINLCCRIVTDGCELPLDFVVFQLATLEGQVDVLRAVLRAVLWDDPRIDLVNARAFEGRSSGAVPFTLDVRDWMTQSSPDEDGNAGEVM